jgi:hypothetical protein
MAEYNVTGLVEMFVQLKPNFALLCRRLASASLSMPPRRLKTPMTARHDHEATQGRHARRPHFDAVTLENSVATSGRPAE